MIPIDAGWTRITLIGITLGAGLIASYTMVTAEVQNNKEKVNKLQHDNQRLHDEVHLLITTSKVHSEILTRIERKLDKVVTNGK